ncbi:MAG TPA: DUF1428 domain-containing protein [Allosphingosinicella sp.]|jgi:uncharacterized protein YbaA (DUF1428 family)|uniref:DUF1428 domain-containing protein n=1 Tax=Allosphingosinicella sp. TaxID=2823234 RepID=UPI002F296FE9
MTYVEGFVCPVPDANRDAYRDHAAAAWKLFQEFGVRRHVEAWGTDVPDGTVTDFRKSVAAEDGENVVFAWFEYPDRATRDQANAKMMSDPRMGELIDMPFDGKRMIMGGFQSILDTGGRRGGFVDGFVLPVPEGNRDAYLALAQKAAAIFAKHGALRLVEAFSDDVPRGKVTDFHRAVRSEEGEGVVFSWIEWPDLATRDAAWAKMRADDEMKDEPMSFDGKRMFWGGFEMILDEQSEAHAEPERELA